MIRALYTERVSSSYLRAVMQELLKFETVSCLR
jgi:hypothetical protein